MRFISPTPTIKRQAEPVPWQEMAIDDFSGGLCTAFPETSIADNQFTTFNNFYMKNRGKSLIVRGRYIPYGANSSLDTVLTTAPSSFHWSRIGTTNYLLASRISGTDVVVAYWTGSAWSTAKTFSGSSAYRTQFIDFAISDTQEVIFFNGSDTPQRWTGSGTSNDLGLDAPDITSDATLSDVAVGIDSAVEEGIGSSGTYYYKLTYWYEAGGTTKYGESNPSSDTFEIAVTVSSGDRQKVEFSGISTFPTGVARIYFYRSPPDNENGIYKQVGYITSGTTFTDSTPNGEEGVELPIDDGGVPALKNCIVFKGRIWGVDGALPTKGVWSPVGQPDIFPAVNYAYFPDELTGPVVFNENLYWFTSKQIYVVPEGDVDKYPEPLKICDRGATSYESIVDVGNGMCFQGENNLYWVDFNTHSLKDGDYPVPIGEPVRNKIEEIPSAYRSNSVGCYYRDRYYLCYTGRNQTANSSTLVWDVETGTGLLHRGIYGGFTSVSWSGNDIQNFRGTLYTANNLTNYYVMEHDTAGVTDYNTEDEYDAGTGHNITTALTTKRFHFGHEWSDKIINSVSVITETSGVTYDVSLSCGDYDYSNDYTKSLLFTLGSDSVTSVSTPLIWDEGTWNNFNWADSNYGFYSNHKRTGGVKCKNAVLSLASANSQDTDIILIKIYYKSLPRPS